MKLIQTRWLLVHPESDCYIEVYTQAEADDYLNEPMVEDVTGIEYHEKEFIAYKKRLNE